MRTSNAASTVLLLCLVGSLRAAGRTVEQVAAEVNGERVMLSEVEREAAEDLAALPADLIPAERRRRERAILRAHLIDIIRRRLLLQAADRELNPRQKSLVERRVEEEIARRIRQAGSRQALERRLAARGRSLDDLTAELRRRITIAFYLTLRLRTGLEVSRRAMEEYFARHRSEFEQPERRVWRMIVIRPDRFSSRDAARRRVEEIHRRLLAGADFAELARRFSHGPRARMGGLWGPLAADEFAVEQVSRAAFHLPPGRVSQVIETPQAFYLVRVESVEPAVKADFPAVQEEIRKKLLAAELERRRRELYRQLQERAFIRVYLR